MRNAKIYLLTLCICMGILCSSCTKNDSNSLSQDEVEIDYSLYDERGSWHSDRMWVHKTESSWDTLEGYYGYINKSGNLVGEWHSDKEWKRPLDFVGDYAIIYLDSSYNGIYYESSHTVEYAMIDKDGVIVHTFKAGNLFKKGTIPRDDQLCNFNEYGLLIYQEPYWGSERKENFHFILENGDDIRIKGSSKYDLSKSLFDEQFINGYLRYRSNSTPLYIDRKGNIVLDLSDFEYPIVKTFPVEDDVVKVVFTGKDSKNYIVSIGLNGEWLTEPQLVDEED